MNPHRPLVRLLVALALAGGVLVTSIVVAQTTSDGWKPYLEEKKGDKEFPEKPNLLKDEKWLNVRYTDFAGYKPRIGVMQSEQRKPGPQEYNNEWIRFFASREGHNEGGLQGVNNVESQVRQALNATNRFTMVERTTALDDVVGEQDMGASGRVDQKTAPRIGKIKGADYTAKVEIVEIDPEKESKSIKGVGGGMGARTLGVASIGVSGKVAWVRINVRLIRTETSEVVADLTVDGTAKEKRTGFGLGVLKGVGGGILGGAGSIDSKKAASLSDALQVAANKAAYFAALELEDVPWQGTVTGVKEGINIGLKEGLVLTLLKKGEEQIDPDTNESLGFESEKIGVVRIVSVSEKFSTCEIVEGGEGVVRGDLVKLERKSGAAASSSGGK